MNLKTSNFLFVLLAFFAISSVIISCKKDDDDATNPITPTGTTIKTSVVGRVTDTNGNIVSGVTIKLGNLTTTSDIRGNFLFRNVDVPVARMVLIADKPGYFDCIRGKKTQQGGANYVDLMMQAYPAAATITGTVGGVVTLPGGATITFPSNAFVDKNGNPYTGQATIYSRHINPAADNFEAIVPGGDLLAMNAANQPKSLYSLGMIEAKLFDNTGLNEIVIAPGKTAELKFPIDPSQASAALNTIPLWHMNETSGIWYEDGQATKSGSFYTGSVTHFSTWNCDYSGERTYVQGKVIDCQNISMAGITVTIDGFMNVTTDNSGMFTAYVPANFIIDFQVLQSQNSFIAGDSPIQTITTSAGILNIVPDLVVPCASRISGAIKACDGITPASAFICVSWNGGYRFVYSENGSYDIYVPVEQQLKIIASSLNLGDEESVLSGTIGTMTQVAPLALCSSPNIPITRFTLNYSGGTVNYVLNVINSTENYVDINSDGAFESAAINLIGILTPGNISCSMQIGLYGETNGYYSLLNNSLNNVYIDIDSVGTYANGNFPTTTLNKLVITDYGSPGGLMTGVFEFNHHDGTLTNGQFSVER